MCRYRLKTGQAVAYLLLLNICNSPPVATNKGSIRESVSRKGKPIKIWAQLCHATPPKQNSTPAEGLCNRSTGLSAKPGPKCCTPRGPTSKPEGCFPCRSRHNGPRWKAGNSDCDMKALKKAGIKGLQALKMFPAPGRGLVVELISMLSF